MTVNQDPESNECYSAEVLLRGMAPLNEVLRAFDRQTGQLPRTLTSQNSFARLVQSAWDDNLGPSKRYLRKLIHRFVSSLDQDVEDEELVQVIHESLCAGPVDMPKADETCCLSFQIPTKHSADIKSNAPSYLRIQVFPQHNDVALKLWEAGACLAEYFLAYPELVSGKSIVELGSGVGLTGIVAAARNARQVHFTDYSDAWLTNMKYNLDINKSWIQEQRGGGDIPHLTQVESSHIIYCRNITFLKSRLSLFSFDTLQGYLNWEECAKGYFCGIDDVFNRSDILFAADVAYDVAVIPSLVETFRQFLISSSSMNIAKLCYLASTLRNKPTHDALECELFSRGIACHYVPCRVIDKLPHVFPVYFTQHRNEIRVCVLTLIE